MARRGSFAYNAGGTGRDLTATIKSLYDQQQSANDKAMFDGWQNGGLVDGKPVTDARILAYIQQRQSQYSKDDPLYSQWGERLQQTQYSIGEQKATLTYRQTGDARVMADFYKSWLGKVPADSAFGRQVATSAAQWAKSAGDAARGAARSRANEALTRQTNAVNSAFGSWGAIEGALTTAGQRAGYISGNQRAEDMTGANLQSLLASGSVIDPTTGKAITEQMWKASGLAYYNALGTASSIQKAEGKSSKTYDNARDKFLTDTLVKQNSMDLRAQYEAARAAFQKADDACQGDPACSSAAAKTYSGILQNIRDNGIAAGNGTTEVDPQFIGGLSTEITILNGGTVGANAQTAAEVDGIAKGNDVATLSDGYANTTAESSALAAGTAYYGQDKPGGKLGVYPAPTGIGGTAMPPDLSPSVVIGANGDPKTAWLAGQAVYSSVLTSAGGAVDPSTLTPAQIQAGLASGALAWSGEQIVGYTFKGPDGSLTYGVKNAQGGLTYTTENPFGQQYGKYVAAPMSGVTASGRSGFSINPDAFVAVIPPGDVQTGLNVAAGISEQDVITAVSQNPGVFGSAGAQLLANVQAVQQVKGNDQLPSTALDYLNANRAAAATAQDIAALQASGPLAAALQASQGVTRGASLAGNVAGTLGPGLYGINGATAGPPNMRGLTNANGPLQGVQGRPLTDVTDILGTGQPPAATPTIKLPNVGVPLAPPPIRQAGVTPQDVLAGPRPPSLAPPPIQPPVAPPLPAGVRQAGVTSQDVIAGPRPPSIDGSGGTGSGSGGTVTGPGPTAV